MTDLAPTTHTTHLEPGIIHLVCCLNPDHAFCGTNRDGHPFTTRDATCVVCIDITDNNPGCPIGGTCPFDP